MTTSEGGRIAPGFYKGRGIAGSEQYGVAGTGNEQLAVDLDIPSLGRALTTFLSFTDKALPYSIERLRALGWVGDDITRLEGIDRNEVDVQIKYETYEGQAQMRVEISTGGGRVKLSNVMDERQRRAFAARLKPLLSGSATTADRQRQPTENRTVRREGAYDPGPPHDDDIPF